jgi:hypothetical protein
MSDDFSDRLGVVCSAEMPLARRDAERMGAMIERLTDALALTIAVAARGNHDGMETFIQGIEAHLSVRALDHAKLVRFMDGAAPLPRNLP